jgi:hypothetical protein
VKKFYSIILIIGFILLLNGCAKAASNKITERVDLKINLTHYEDIVNLYKDSYVIVLGKPVENRETLKIIVKTISTKEQIYSPVFFEISEVVKGNDKQCPGNTVLLNQPGGIYNNVEYIEKSTSYLKIGKQYILFLKDEDGGNYTLASPYEGMMEIVNDYAIPRTDNSIFTSKLSLYQLKEKLNNASN